MNQKEYDMTALTQFLAKHGMGVDDLFFVVHLGARQLALKEDAPPPVREHWQQIAEECYDLWHNTDRSGTRLA